MNTTLEEKKCKKELLDKCWSYFNDNFHKFTEVNKIKIGLVLCAKDMPTQIEGEILKSVININSNGKTQPFLNRLEHKPETVSGELPIQ